MRGFLSVDPLTRTYPMLTPYQFAANRPIAGVDLDGLEFKDATTGEGVGPRERSNYDGHLIYDVKDQPGVFLPPVEIVETNLQEPMDPTAHQIQNVQSNSLSINDFSLGAAGLATAGAESVSKNAINSRGFSGPSNISGLSQSQISMLRLNNPIYQLRGNQVYNLYRGANVVGVGFAAYGYANTLNDFNNGSIGGGRATVDAGVNTIAWRLGLPGAAVGVGYGVLGPAAVDGASIGNYEWSGLKNQGWYWRYFRMGIGNWSEQEFWQHNPQLFYDTMYKNEN